MNLFTIKNNYPAILPEALLIPEFRVLWDRDKTTGRSKSRAVEDLAYVYYMMDYQSAYRAYPPEERKEELRKDIITRSRWKEDPEIVIAMAKYDKLQETPNMRFLKAVEQTLEGLTTYFENLNFDPNKKDEEGKKVPIDDAKKAMEAASKAGPLLASIQTLREKVRSEQNVGAIVRGGGTVGMYEG